ncbi:MAG: hypothetical protein R3237_00835 [Nitrosopumilaceae archaeon]|nr:hypothetical protein [Nitrosopumilaceae archaeon]
MTYEELINDSITFFENAQKRALENLEQTDKDSTKLQIKKELEAFEHLKGFWSQEKLRIELNKKYSPN